MKHNNQSNYRPEVEEMMLSEEIPNWAHLLFIVLGVFSVIFAAAL